MEPLELFFKPSGQSGPGSAWIASRIALSPTHELEDWEPVIDPPYHPVLQDKSTGSSSSWFEAAWVLGAEFDIRWPHPR